MVATVHQIHTAGPWTPRASAEAFLLMSGIGTTMLADRMAGLRSPD